METDMAAAFSALGGVISGVGLQVKLLKNELAGRIKALVTKVDNLASEVESVKETGEQTVTMHEHPDDYGFGSRATNAKLDNVVAVAAETNRLILANSRDTRDLILTMRASMDATGHALPPLPDDRG